MITPHDFQFEAVDAVFESARKAPDEGHLIVAPTASGKSVINAEMARRVAQDWHGRYLMLVRSQELISQNKDRLLQLWPDAPVGINSASLGQRSVGKPIIFASIDSVHKIAHELGRINVCNIDEAHHINPAKEGRYRAFLDDLLRYNPGLIRTGMTATPFRGNGVWLTDGPDPLFDRMAYEIKMRWLLDNGYLSPLVPPESELQTRYSSEGIKSSGGDFNLKQLAKAHDTESLVNAACDEIVRHGRDRKSWIIFGITIAHCNHVKDALSDRGIDAEVISDKTPKDERNRLVKAHRSGVLRCLISVNVLSTGFDSPGTDLVALLRSTKSPVFYVQAAGRGMRVSPGKDNALWLDFTDTTERMGPVDQVRGRRYVPKSGEAEAPYRLCDACNSRNVASAPMCAQCGELFDSPDRINHKATVSGAAVLSSTKPEVVEVAQVNYKKHTKRGKTDQTPTMRVEYVNAMGQVFAKEWVSIEGPNSFAKMKAGAWWKMRRPYGDAPPVTVDQALEVADGLTRPRAVAIIKQGKYNEVMGYDWG